ncbi:MAG: hypothetical protein GX773_07885, partial [Chloroflexi bacterium]|nr:hypothetical protein [Chloroflexota bacterium]
MTDIKAYKLTTPWKPAEPIPWPEYPRPQMARDHWQNLNGWWDYSFQHEDLPKPSKFDGKILVPFAPESALSGVERVLQPDEKLWYRREFDVSYSTEQIVMLHFGAVDHSCQVWVNGQLVGDHWGGFLPFSFEITSALTEGQNELIVMVQDPTEAALHQKGKQRLQPGGIWYTSISGIWQTVWLEVLPRQHIRSLKIPPSV